MENVSQMSLLEVAVLLIGKKKGPQSIYNIIKEVLEIKGLEDEDGSIATKLYLDITTSSKFVYMGEDSWDLKSRQSLDEYDKDGSAFNSKEDLEDLEDLEPGEDDDQDIEYEEDDDLDDEYEDDLDDDYDDDLDDEDEEDEEDDDYENDDYDDDAIIDDEFVERYDEDDFNEDKYNDLMDDYEDMYEE